MRIRNNSETDCYIFRLNIAAGQTITVPETLDPAKKAQLARMFEVLPDAVSAPAAEEVRNDAAIDGEEPPAAEVVEDGRDEIKPKRAYRRRF